MVKREGKQWIKVACSKTYVPSEDDNGCLLRLESTALDSSTGNLCPLQVFITEPVAALPSSPPRHMLHIRTPASNSYHEAQPTQDVTFSLLSYNILCGSLAYDFSYPHCPNWALAWEYRRQKLLHEIMEYNADIICLQEVAPNSLAFVVVSMLVIKKLLIGLVMLIILPIESLLFFVFSRSKMIILRTFLNLC